MNKLFRNVTENKWFIRGLALILALLLYITAYIDENSLSFSQSNNSVSATIEDVPLTVLYDEDNFVVSDIPPTVNVHIVGNNSLVQSAKTLRDFTVYVDLRNAPIGTQRVDVQIEGLSDRLSVRIEPSSIVVNVQEKVTKEFPVSVELNQDILEEGYTFGEPTIEPATVVVTGGKDVISQVTFVKAIVEQAGTINSSFSQDAFVSVLDRNLNKLDVLVEPGEVKVTVPIISPSKKVPISIKREGEVADGIIIQGIVPETNEIELIGSLSILKDIKEIELPVDVTNITENTVIKVPVAIPEGVSSVSPEEVSVQIFVAREQSRTINDVSISVEGLPDGYSMEFLSPEEGQVNITITGLEEVIETIDADDFTLSIDVSGLEPNQEHQLSISVDGPDNLNWELSQEDVTIMITENE